MEYRDRRPPIITNFCLSNTALACIQKNAMPGEQVKRRAEEAGYPSLALLFLSRYLSLSLPLSCTLFRSAYTPRKIAREKERVRKSRKIMSRARDRVGARRLGAAYASASQARREIRLPAANASSWLFWRMADWQARCVRGKSISWCWWIGQ